MDKSDIITTVKGIRKHGRRKVYKCRKGHVHMSKNGRSLCNKNTWKELPGTEKEKWMEETKRIKVIHHYEDDVVDEDCPTSDDDEIADLKRQVSELQGQLRNLTERFSTSMHHQRLELDTREANLMSFVENNFKRKKPEGSFDELFSEE